MNQQKKNSLKTRPQTNPVSSTAGFLLSPSNGEKILPGSGPPPHLHENEDESIYVIDGEFEILLGAKTMRAEPEAFVFIPKRTVHRFRCIGDGPGKVLLHFTPGGIEGFFREAGVPATNDGLAPSVDSAEITRTDMAGKRYGLRVIDWEDGKRVDLS